MKGLHINSKSLLWGISLILFSPFSFSKPAITCPSTSVLQSLVVTKDDLEMKKAPVQTCCTASGFPYIEDGEWVLKRYDNFGTENTWELDTNAKGESIQEAFREVRNKFKKLRQPWLGSYFGRWYCDYTGLLLHLK